jgi:hypothetical protein
VRSRLPGGADSWMIESLFIGTSARFPDRVEMRFVRVA